MLFLYLKFQKIISKFEKYEDTETQRKCFNKDRNKKKCDKDWLQNMTRIVKMHKKAKIIAIYQKKCEKGEALWKDKSILGGAK